MPIGLCHSDIKLKFNDDKSAKEYITKLVADDYNFEFSFYIEYEDKTDRYFYIVDITDIIWTNNIKYAVNLLKEEEDEDD